MLKDYDFYILISLTVLRKLSVHLIILKDYNFYIIYNIFYITV